MRRNKTQNRWKTREVKTNLIGRLTFCGWVRLESGSGRFTLTHVFTKEANENKILIAMISIRSRIINDMNLCHINKPNFLRFSSTQLLR